MRQCDMRGESICRRIKLGSAQYLNIDASPMERGVAIIAQGLSACYRRRRRLCRRASMLPRRRRHRDKAA